METPDDSAISEESVATSSSSSTSDSSSPQAFNLKEIYHLHKTNSAILRHLVGDKGLGWGLGIGD